MEVYDCCPIFVVAVLKGGRKLIKNGKGTKKEWITQNLYGNTILNVLILKTVNLRA